MSVFKQSILILNSSSTSGFSQAIRTNGTNAEQTFPAATYGYGFSYPTQTTGGTFAFFINPYVEWTFGRAPGFFDEVCYTGIASTNQRVLHNLTVPPELIIVKARNQTNSWWVYNVTTGRSKYAEMQTTNAFGTSANIWGTADPTSTDFGVNSNGIG